MIINFGSLNVDYVYRVEHMPVPGETLAVKSFQKFLGGKGANQSIAIARSGGVVRHIGAIGPDGDWARQALQAASVDPGHLAEVEDATGHAVITVDDAGENMILICGGANQCLATDQIVRELDDVPGKDNWVLLQNETNLTGEIVAEAKARGFKIAYSAAPFVAGDALPLLEEIDLIAVNQVEAQALADAGGREAIEKGGVAMLVTKGADGAVYHTSGKVFGQVAFEVKPVDTTGAGDTFLGAFLARYTLSSDIKEALRYAAAASAIQVTRPGAAAAIPDEQEVLAFL